MHILRYLIGFLVGVAVTFVLLASTDILPKAWAVERSCYAQDLDAQLKRGDTSSSEFTIAYKRPGCYHDAGYSILKVWVHDNDYVAVTYRKN